MIASRKKSTTSNESQRQSQLLKRNISMNRRKSQLILKGQLEKSKRLGGTKVVGADSTRSDSLKLPAAQEFVARPSINTAQKYKQQLQKQTVAPPPLHAFPAPRA